MVSKVVFITNLTAIQTEIRSLLAARRTYEIAAAAAWQRLHRACESVFGSWRRYVRGPRPDDCLNLRQRAEIFSPRRSARIEAALLIGS